MDSVDHLIIISKGKKVADGSLEDLKDNFYYKDLKNSKVWMILMSISLDIILIIKILFFSKKICYNKFIIERVG